MKGGRAQSAPIPEGVTGQDEVGRLWDILWMFRWAAARFNGDTLLFKLYVRNHNRKRLDHRDLVTLKAVCGPRRQQPKVAAAVKTQVVELKRRHPDLGIQKISQFLRRVLFLPVSRETVRRTLHEQQLTKPKPKPANTTGPGPPLIWTAVRGPSPTKPKGRRMHRPDRACRAQTLRSYTR